MTSALCLQTSLKGIFGGGWAEVIWVLLITEADPGVHITSAIYYDTTLQENAKLIPKYAKLL